MLLRNMRSSNSIFSLLTNIFNKNKIYCFPYPKLLQYLRISEQYVSFWNWVEYFGELHSSSNTWNETYKSQLSSFAPSVPFDRRSLQLLNNIDALFPYPRHNWISRCHFCAEGVLLHLKVTGLGLFMRCIILVSNKILAALYNRFMKLSEKLNDAQAKFKNYSWQPVACTAQYVRRE